LPPSLRLGEYRSQHESLDIGESRDSVVRCSAAGPTARSTARAGSAPRPLTDGYGTTTITENTQPSATSPDRSPQRTTNQPSRYLQLAVEELCAGAAFDHARPSTAPSRTS